MDVNGLLDRPLQSFYQPIIDKLRQTQESMPSVPTNLHGSAPGVPSILEMLRDSEPKTMQEQAQGVASSFAGPIEKVLALRGNPQSMGMHMKKAFDDLYGGRSSLENKWPWTYEGNGGYTLVDEPLVSNTRANPRAIDETIRQIYRSTEALPGDLRTRKIPESLSGVTLADDRMGGPHGTYTFDGDDWGDIMYNVGAMADRLRTTGLKSFDGLGKPTQPMPEFSDEVMQLLIRGAKANENPESMLAPWRGYGVAAHETGHAISSQLWDDVSPFHKTFWKIPDDASYRQMFTLGSSESPDKLVNIPGGTTYGQTLPEEDFADTFSLYHQYQHPYSKQHKAVLDEVIKRLNGRDQGARMNVMSELYGNLTRGQY